MSERVVHYGHCLCGAVRFEAEGQPKWIAFCHCESCRRHTASPVAVFVGFDERNFRFTADLPQVFESSKDVRRSFCRACGSPLTYQSARYPDEVHVYAGVMDDPSRYQPTAHVHFAEHLPWFDTVDGHRRHDRNSTG
ncbi:MAG: GFA family protein [Pseudomonadota bacterium]|nr:GFA family protein [Pseudomonadota bacterium]